MARTSQKPKLEYPVANDQAIWMPLKSAYDFERISNYFAKAILIVADACAIYAALFLAVNIELRITALNSQQTTDSLGILANNPWIVVFAGVLCILYEGLYSKRLRFWQETQYLIRSVGLSVAIIYATLVFGNTDNQIAGAALLLMFLLTMVILPLGRNLAKTMMQNLGIGIEPVIILGAGRTGIAAANSLIEQRHLGYKVVGFLDEDLGKQHSTILLRGQSVQVLGSFRDTDSVMSKTGARHLIVAAPNLPSKMLAGLVNRLQREAVSVTVVSNLNGVAVMDVDVDNTLGDKFLSLHFKNNLAKPFNRFLKRSFDLLAGSLLLVMLAPVLLGIVVAIKLTSPGPAIFSHTRIRMHSKPFGCYKFRTMYTNAQEILGELLRKDPKLREEWERDFKLKNDPRVTPIGRILRKTSLDELPQIFNVLKGEMSLVGPRPVIDQEVERFGYLAAYYYMVRPGITGLWQVSGRSDIDYDERIELEARYVRNWSLWQDITILIRTVKAVLAKKGAY